MAETEGRAVATRRDFLKAAGLGALGLAAASGGLGLTGCAGQAQAAGAKTVGGIQVTDESLYTDVFPVPTRSIPVLDVPTDMVRRGTVAFEMRDIPAGEITRSEDWDVLVVGAGITGSVAGLAASDDPSTKVLVIEKMDVGRGIFEGMGVVGGKAMTEADNIVDPAYMADRMYHAAYYRVPPEPIQTWVHRSGEAADWLQEKFDEGDMEITTSFKKGNPNAHNFDVPQTEITFHSPQWTAQTTGNAGGMGIYIVKDLCNTLSKRSNVDLRYNTPAVQLVRADDGRVTGAICKDEDGYFKVNARNGVILATGGYDANPDMMKAWCRAEDIANSASWCPTLGTTGDGHLMGLMVGAQMDPIPHAVMNFNWGSPDSFYSGCFGISGVMVNGIMVNEKGNRFCSESLPFQARGNAISAQAGYGANCWSVAGVNALGADPAATQEKLAPFLEKGWAVQADTIEELAEKMNVPPDNLKATVERYNGFVANLKDEDFNKPLTEKTLPVDGAPYTALQHQESILATVSGLVVDGECRVLDYDNEVIPGLYAAGCASGGFFSGNYPRHVFGPSIGRCVCFGYVSGQNASRGL
ncbi:MAG: FAD-binding protein [Eggerthellaceae bacterium]|nr:FAD-binding protein [Eggerthellaceae bacterium]